MPNEILRNVRNSNDANVLALPAPYEKPNSRAVSNHRNDIINNRNYLASRH